VVGRARGHIGVQCALAVGAALELALEPLDVLSRLPNLGTRLACGGGGRRAA
jgi:hypothetical protein